MSDLKPCPCGKVPEKLYITAEFDTPKYARVGGTCCSEWEVEARLDYLNIQSPEAMKEAVEAWNDAQRGTGIDELEQRLAAAEAKTVELEKELFILASDVVYCRCGHVTDGLQEKAKRIYDELCESRVRGDL